MDLIRQRLGPPHSRVILLFGVLLLALGVLFGVYKLLDSSTIVVNIQNTVDVTQTVVNVDNQRAVLRQQGDRYFFRVRVPKGAYQITIDSVGFEQYTQQSSVGFRETKELDITLSPLQPASAVQVAEEIYLEEGVAIQNAQYFGEGGWMVFFVQSTSSEEGSIAVARKTSGNGWNIVEEGSDIDTESSLYEDAPADLLSFLEER